MSACAHDVVFGGMCATCGASVDTSSFFRPGFITTGELQVSSKALEDLEPGADRLALILDLDHTLATMDTERGQLIQRPGLQEFLQKAQELCELYLYTQATGAYAEWVVKGFGVQCFGEPLRIFHRENTPPGLKDLKQIFPKNRRVLVADDREDVWPRELRGHVLKVLPFLPSPGDLRQGLGLEQWVTGITQTELTPLAKRRRLDESKAFCAAAKHEKDQQLHFLAKILQRIEAEAPGREIPEVVRSLRQDVLKGCRIGLSGMSEEAKRRLAQICVLLGAHLEAPWTHLVAALRTERVWRHSEAGDLEIVHPGWLLYAYVTWEKAEETRFPLPLRGDLPSFLEIW